VAISWRAFLTQTKTYTDVNGVELTVTLPPSWLIELQLWEILEESLFDSFGKTLGDPDSVIQALSFFTGLSIQEIEDRFSGDVIEQMFIDLWDSIKPETQEIQAAQKAEKSLLEHEVDLFTHSLAMFAVECGWTPMIVLSMPKRQINLLGSAVSDYVASRLKFHAAIHGAEIEGEPGAQSAQNVTQLGDDVDILKQLQSQGLPIEVR